MGKKVLILSSSPRRNGNSDLLCDRFAEGAGKAGHQVEKIRLAEKKIGYCTACYACRNGKCPQQDDAPEILEKMLAADVIVLATPVNREMLKGTIEALRGFLDCYEGSVEAGMICGLGVYEKGEVRDQPVWEEAYRAGLQI